MNRILIVEDEFSISNFMKTVLEGDGYAAEVATCAAQARAALAKEPFAAMLLDLGLPDADGIIPAPESAHAIAAAIREAKKCKEEGRLLRLCQQPVDHDVESTLLFLRTHRVGANQQPDHGADCRMGRLPAWWQRRYIRPIG